MRAPGRRFLTRGIRVSNTPLRPFPEVADEEEIVERIRDAATIRDEPECVGPAIADEFGAHAAFLRGLLHASWVEGAREARHGVAHEVRVAVCRDRSRQQHRTDLRGDLLALERALEQARARASRTTEVDARGFTSPAGDVVLSAAALARLERVEAQLDRASRAA